MGGGLGAVGGTESVVHIHVTQRRQFLREGIAVFFLANIHAAIFQQHHSTGCHGHAIEPIGDQRHIALQQFTHAPGDRCQRIFGFELAFGGATQVGSDHHGRASVECQLNRRQRGANACVVGDVTGVILRHIQVGADKNTFVFDLAGGGKIGEAEGMVFSHGNKIIWSGASG